MQLVIKPRKSTAEYSIIRLYFLLAGPECIDHHHGHEEKCNNNANCEGNGGSALFGSGIAARFAQNFDGVGPRKSLAATFARCLAIGVKPMAVWTIGAGILRCSCCGPGQAVAAEVAGQLAVEVQLLAARTMTVRKRCVRLRRVHGVESGATVGADASANGFLRRHIGPSIPS